MQTRPPLTLTLADADATTRLGARLAPLLRAGDVVLLEGPIGAGKTHFARAVIQARLAMAGRQEDVPSPTFTLVQVYSPDVPEIWHADLYRLGHPDEVLELGLDEAFAQAICLVEWPDRLGDLTPRNALTLRFAATPDGAAREVCATATDPRWNDALVELARADGAAA
ncbi:tRNA (adenosine(37)-N6)-threonylcarbamoyltransferase complex ATPase subunit type 1 TsaE [Phaeovulum sp. NW3]|uniref:tRNA (adenosine(37)-N6)-threonylcarbamoyltransferase complex ATPase subunit type 1 TsaE n=1 Tax=Phaeovulum sp. NW3 TaxID=2934933 RepID=UPI00202199A3|nr:tRNA (adenosine(37)-N6)-threonylcarbamoyltransferase complex ATPase subunit type 1 TsaE [Phaeovulum sp. NW3]MCL7465218.1 tRNA (adenosine(37)-N6)-threonylcarbamoyltransferase complex ATPase subunit type 1 TsaE [Phaeovulum sp. NW3]